MPEPVFHGDQLSHSVASPLPPPSVQPPAPNDESRSLRNMVHQLIDVCRANQSHLTGLREEVATLRSLVNTLVARPPPPPQPIPQPRLIRKLLVLCQKFLRGGSGRQPHVCRREGCSAPVPNRCRVRFCQDHCTSPRCNVHARQTRSQERHCRFRGCQARVPAEFSSGSAMSIALALSVLCMSLRSQDAHLQVATLLQVQDVWSIPQLPKWQGSGNPVRGGLVIPVGTFNARRLWYGDGPLHDGFRVLTHILSVWSISVLCISGGPGWRIPFASN